MPALGVQSLFAPPSGDRLGVLTRLGELWLLDFRTGELLDHAALTDRLHGARFSRDCGLDLATLEAIVRLGGIVSDCDHRPLTPPQSAAPTGGCGDAVAPTRC